MIGLGGLSDWLDGIARGRLLLAARAGGAASLPPRRLGRVRDQHGRDRYTLGMRHAFDADHISAIDNTTRKLMAEGKRPTSVGFFFSLGHSAVVFVLAFLFAIGIKALDGPVKHTGSQLHNVTGLIGTGVSGTFLYVIAALNLVILGGIIKVFREMRGGAYDEAQLEHQLNTRGLMNRFFHRFTRAIDQPWKMYPLGVLFGLGFDTATEVALLFLAAGAAGAGLPVYAIICLPILFAAGMSLLEHDRRNVHELRLRLGVLEARTQGLLQHRRDWALGRGGAGDRHDRAGWPGGPEARRLWIVLDLAREHQHQHARLHHRRHVHRHLGSRAGDLALCRHRRALDPVASLKLLRSVLTVADHRSSAGVSGECAVAGRARRGAVLRLANLRSAG